MSTSVVVPARAAAPQSKKSKKKPRRSICTLLLLLLGVVEAICCIAFIALALSYRHLPVSAFFSETVSPGDGFDHALLGRGVLENSFDFNILAYMSCSEFDQEIVSSPKWKSCEGVWNPDPLSLSKNVREAQLSGFVRPNLPKTKECGRDPWGTTTLNPRVDAELALSAREDSAIRHIAYKYGHYLDDRIDSRYLNMKCNSAGSKSYHTYLAVLCIFIVLVSFVASISAVFMPRSCFRRSPFLFMLSTFLFVAATLFTAANWGAIEKFSRLGYSQCKDFSPEEYYSRLPPDTCRVTTRYNECVERNGYQEISALGATNEEQWKEKDYFMRQVMCLNEAKSDNGFGVFVKQEEMNEKCESQTAVCASSVLTRNPENKPTDGEEKFCYQCTHGPRWDLNAQSATQISAIESDGTNSIWNDGYQKTSISSCMWVDEPYAGHSESERSNAAGKTCVNREANIESSMCKDGSLARFLFEFGTPRSCHSANGSAASHPGCTSSNYEKCYVKRGHEEPVQDGTVPYSQGGVNTGENNCILNKYEETKCVCKCDYLDFQSGKCDRDGEKHIMKESHELYELCKDFGTCKPSEEKKKCEFLFGSHSNPNPSTTELYSNTDFIHRFVAENEICQGRDAATCSNGWYDHYCHVDRSDMCVPVYVECNDDQIDYFQKLKAKSEFDTVDKRCITDHDGNYLSVPSVIVSQHGTIAEAACVSLFSMSAILLALAAGLYTSDTRKENRTVDL